MTATRLLTIVAFGLALAGLGAVEWAARRDGSRVPTLGEICGFVMTYRVGPMPVGRIAVFGFWWWLGWHFFAR
jgi:1,4-dihydroxy-2-naphthoate octaprenyltransferase